MTIQCPQCLVEFRFEDIRERIRHGRLICPVCSHKIPVAANGTTSHSGSPSKRNWKLFAALGLFGVCCVGGLWYFMVNKPVFRHDAPPSGARHFVEPGPSQITHQTSSSPAINPVDADVRSASAPTENPAAPDKMKIIEHIAAQYHQSHSYTLEGDFVCLDMAIDVWNQLVTNGIEAKIMGGNIRENITAWTFRQLVQESDHAWVVARLGPKEKIAIETTQGKIIKQDMPDASAYFRGIEFDSPAQIKHFDLLRKKMNDVCRSAQEFINDWNQNVAGKQLPAAEAIARKSRLEQKKQECENTYQELKAFEGKAVFY